MCILNEMKYYASQLIPSSSKIVKLGVLLCDFIVKLKISAKDFSIQLIIRI